MRSWSIKAIDVYQALDILNCRSSLKFRVEKYQNGITGKLTFGLFLGKNRLPKGNTYDLDARQMYGVIMALADLVHIYYLQEGKSFTIKGLGVDE